MEPSPWCPRCCGCTLGNSALACLRVAIASWPKSLPMRLAADLVFEGPVNDAGAIESLYEAGDVWVQQGRSLTLSPRMGMEVEVAEDRLRLRAGTWREASRLQQLAGTWHGTAGLELKLLPSVRRGLGAGLDRGVRGRPGEAGFTNVNWLTLGFWGERPGGGRGARASLRAETWSQHPFRAPIERAVQAGQMLPAMSVPRPLKMTAWPES